MLPLSTLLLTVPLSGKNPSGCLSDCLSSFISVHSHEGRYLDTHWSDTLGISQCPHPMNKSEDGDGSANFKEVKQQVGIECEWQADGECISKRGVLPRCGAANTITNHSVVYRKDMCKELLI